jgi:large subunit ribosomal protein L6
MSRIGKKLVAVPKEAKVAIQTGQINVEGPKGKLSMDLPANIVVSNENGQITVTRQKDAKQDRANHGTVRAKIVNMLKGVTQGQKKDLEIQGVGFRAQIQGSKLVLNLGYSNPVEFDLPKDVKVSAPSQVNISVEGIDKVRVGQVAASIRMLK